MPAPPPSPGSGKLVGSEAARLFTEPARPLTRATSRGFEVADFAEHVLGEPLLPWQRWLAIRALELNPDGTYRFRTVLTLVARQSGKSHLLKVMALWRMYIDGARLVVGAAQNMQLARESWLASIEMAKAVPDLAAEIAKVSLNNNDPHLALSSGARYKIVAATRGSGRGLSADLLVLDEVREQRDWAAWSSLSKTTMARPMGQIWAISNAGDDQSVVLNHLREAALSGADPTIGIFEWSAEDGCDLDDPAAWCAANPGLGHTISEQAIRSALATDPPAVFRTEVLCQRVESLDEAVNVAAWRDCADAKGSMDGLRERVVTCLDVAPDGRHVTLVAAAVTADGRVRVEVVDAWKSTEEARRALPDLLARVKPVATTWFPTGPAAALAHELRAAPGSTEIKGAAVVEVCQEFSDLVLARRVVHPGDGLLDAHVLGARKYHQGDGWRFERKGPSHVDALYAAAGAVHLARSVPARAYDPLANIG